MEEEAISSTPGKIALGVAGLALAGSLASVVASLASGACSTCCALIGWAGALIPAASGLLGLIALILAVVIRMRGSAGEGDPNPKLATIAIALSLVAMVIDAVALVIALWATFAYIIMIVISAILNLLGMN